MFKNVISETIIKILQGVIMDTNAEISNNRKTEKRFQSLQRGKCRAFKEEVNAQFEKKKKQKRKPF